MTWRLVGAMMSVTLVVALSILIPVSGYLIQNERDRLMTSLERDAFVLAGRSSEALEAPDDESEADAAIDVAEIALAYSLATGARAVIVDAAGIAIVTSDQDEDTVGSSLLSRPEIATALDGGIASGTRDSQTLGLELLYVAVPVLAGAEVVGAVRLTYPADVVSAAVNSQVSPLVLVALTTVLVGGVVGLIIALSITRRLHELTEITESFADGKLDERADASTGAPELRSLARSFNVMAERLSDALELQRRFAADASHQLRTPLTALRLRFERARQLLESDPAAAADRLASAEEELQRLDGIVEGLLAMSRTEGAVVQLADIDLARIARERVEHWEPLAAEQASTVRYEGDDHALVHASEAVLEQIIDNYVDNALEATPRGAAVIVRVEAHPRGVELHVLDSGPGLAEDQLARAFERFWRGRADSTGTGLGLAIVARLANAVGAEAGLANRASGGADAWARFAPARAVPGHTTDRETS